MFGPARVIMTRTMTRAGFIECRCLGESCKRYSPLASMSLDTSHPQKSLPLSYFATESSVSPTLFPQDLGGGLVQSIAGDLALGSNTICEPFHALEEGMQ
jgi:hypothetical protein